MRCVLNMTMICLQDNAVRGAKREQTNENMKTAALQGGKNINSMSLVSVKL
jgi:hypothetical protein